MAASSPTATSISRCKHGERRGIIGPNGAGKTTFFKMLTCEVQPTSGQIVFEGRDITGMSVTDVCQLGLTKSYQVNQLFTRLTVRENLTIAALAELRGKFRLDMFGEPAQAFPASTEQVERTLELVDLTERADTPVSELAYGEKRRLEVGLALASSPSLLLLDEPLAGMSPRERVEMVKLLKSISRGRTMIIIDHDMDSLFELVERVTVLQEGRVLVEGTPNEIKGNNAVQEAYLGGVHARMSLLEVNGLNSYYGDSHILFDVSLRVERNEVVALLGRNGAGKSTTLKSLMGVVTPRTGSIMFDGDEIAGKKSHAIAQAGMQLVHEDRRIFGSLNVEENIILAGLTAPKPLAARPRLRHVSAAQGAARAAAAPTCPAASSRCWRLPARWSAIRRSCCSTSRSRVWRRSSCATCWRPAASWRMPGQTIVLVEQNISAAMALAHRVYIINNGHIVESMTAQAVRDQPELLHRHLGV